MKTNFANRTEFSQLKEDLIQMATWEQARAVLLNLRATGQLNKEEFTKVGHTVANYFLFCAEDLQAR